MIAPPAILFERNKHYETVLEIVLVSSINVLIKQALFALANVLLTKLFW